MPAKKKVEVDHRTQTEIQIDQTNDQIKQTEAQIQHFKEAISDLSVHTVKIKQLETEIGPRETEYKAVVANFHKLLDHASNIKKQLSPEEMLAAQNTSSPGNRSHGGSRAATATPGMRGQTPNPDAEKDDSADKELLKHLQHVVRDGLTSLLTPYFNKSKTSLEREKEIQKEQEAALAAQQALEAAANPPSTIASPEKPKAEDKKKAGKGAAANVDAKSEKVDEELICPPGVDMSVFEEVLKLRHHRIHAEKNLQTVQTQLSSSRSIVNRRREEGASKSALKKAEKQLIFLQKQVGELKELKAKQDALKAQGVGEVKGRKKK